MMSSGSGTQFLLLCGKGRTQAVVKEEGCP